MNNQNLYAIFTKNELHYCIPVENVREVIRSSNIILSPLQLAGFFGFINFRESLCPVFDINGVIQKIYSQELSNPFNIMVIEYDGILFAILIDKFIESQVLDDEENLIENDSQDKQSLLINKVFRYREIALYRIDIYIIKNIIVKNINNNEIINISKESNVGIEINKSEEIEMICFTIENFLFGIPITDLVEVIEGYGMQPLFRVNKFLRGLINLRGQIIACVDISETIGLEPRRMEEKNQYILLQNEDSDLALCIDSISKKQMFHRGDIQNVESIFSGELAEYLLGIIEKNSERIFIISGSKIFESKYLIPNRE